MKTLEEILAIVNGEIEKYPQRNEYNLPSTIDVLTVEGIKKQVESAPEDTPFGVYWLETIPAGEGSLADGFAIQKQFFNNKKEMIPVERENK